MKEFNIKTGSQDVAYIKSLPTAGHKEMANSGVSCN